MFKTNFFCRQRRQIDHTLVRISQYLVECLSHNWRPCHARRPVIARCDAQNTSVRWILVGASLLGYAATTPPLATAQVDRLDRIDDHFSTKLFRPRPSARNARPSGARPPAASYRTMDGTNNNLQHSSWGSASQPLWRRAPAEYSDDIEEPARLDSASAREISNAIFAQTSSVVNQGRLTDMTWQWGQFLDHDIDLTGSALPLDSFPIEVPAGDPWFDPAATGTELIYLFRSDYMPASGIATPREQVNSITSWIDGSNIYGSDDETAAALRSFQGGQLRVHESEHGNLLPLEDGFFVSGDVRVNEQVYLTAMHTLFMREHNRICNNLQTKNDKLSDEQLFQIARKEVVGIMQAITYNEFLPALLGRRAMGRYQGYRPQVIPNVSNEFATAAYRFGHSMLSSELLRLDHQGNEIAAGNLQLANAFFRPSEIIAHGIDPHINGLIHHQAQQIDHLLVDDVRNFLFGPPGAGGFDLASLNIQRGRDHGLCGMNELRRAYHLPLLRRFSDLTRDRNLQKTLAELYETPDDIDPWVGMLCEKHLPGANLGLTAWTIIRDQFQRLRDGDRFWYERVFRGRELTRIRQTRLSDVIRRNTSIPFVRRDVFHMSTQGKTVRPTPPPRPAKPTRRPRR